MERYVVDDKYFLVFDTTSEVEDFEALIDAHEKGKLFLSVNSTGHEPERIVVRDRHTGMVTNKKEKSKYRKAVPGLTDEIMIYFRQNNDDVATTTDLVKMPRFSKWDYNRISAALSYNFKKGRLRRSKVKGSSKFHYWKR